MVKQNRSLLLVALCYKSPFFGQYAGGVALLHYPACKPGSLISAGPAQASRSVNLQDRD